MLVGETQPLPWYGGEGKSPPFPWISGLVQRCHSASQAEIHSICHWGVILPEKSQEAIIPFAINHGKYQLMNWLTDGTCINHSHYIQYLQKFFLMTVIDILVATAIVLVFPIYQCELAGHHLHVSSCGSLHPVWYSTTVFISMNRIGVLRCELKSDFGDIWVVVLSTIINHPPTIHQRLSTHISHHPPSTNQA